MINPIINTDKSILISNICLANDALLMNDIYLVLLNATNIPPHILLSINGKLFTLTVKGPTVDGELTNLLRLIRKQNTPTLFVKLKVPLLFTMDDLNAEIRKYTLGYNRVDVGIATCLSPIKDFCFSVYKTQVQKINFVFDLIPQLDKQAIVSDYYHLNLQDYLMPNNSFMLSKYSMNDIYEHIHVSEKVAV